MYWLMSLSMTGSGQLGGVERVDPVVGEDQVDHVGGGERAVDGQVGGHARDQLGVGDRVAEALGGDRGGQHPQELVVPPDPGQVALGLLGPVVGVRRGHSRPLVLQVTGPDDLERVDPVEVDASGRRMSRPEYASNTGSGKYMLTPPSVSTTFAKVSKLSST